MSSEMKVWDAVPGNEFDDERDLKKTPTWSCDMSHSWPRMMPMEGWFWVKYLTPAWVEMIQKISSPVTTGALRRIRKGGDYATMITVTDPEEIKQREVKFKEQVLAYSADLPQWWQRAKQELLRIYSGLKGLDLDNALNAELLHHLYDLIDAERKMWGVHFRGLVPVTSAWILFEDLCKELLGLTDLSTDFQKLISGYDNKMLQVDKRMWLLGRSAVDKGIGDVIVYTKPEKVLRDLEVREEAKTWLKDFKDFLNEDGWRIAHLQAFHEPTWLEDPTPVIRRLRAFIRKGGDFGPDKERPKLAKERGKATKALLMKVPDERKDEFNKLLQAVQFAGVFNEEHTYYCENYCHSLVRRGLLGIGRRLVKTGVIDQPEDIFFLNPPEVEGVLPGPEGCDLRWIVERRRKEWEKWTKIDIPPIMTRRRNLREAWEKDLFYWREPVFEKIAIGAPPEVKTDLKADLYGLSVSCGVIEGKARVVVAAEELGQLQEGEILVAPSTTTSWTPVFGIISGVVTEVGGALSHTAIVSREHGIPAVTNVGEATTKIKTGQKIRVNGDEGAVFILE